MRPLLRTVFSTAFLLAVPLGTAALADDSASSPAKAAQTGSVNRNMGKGPAEQSSVPSSAPTPSTHQSTGATHQNATVKSMNKQANDRIQTEGK